MHLYLKTLNIPRINILVSIGTVFVTCFIGYCNTLVFLDDIDNKRFVQQQIIIQGRKFNDALNTFYLRLYGTSHMVKDHSDSERGNPLSPHGPLSD